MIESIAKFDSAFKIFTKQKKNKDFFCIFEIFKKLKKQGFECVPSIFFSSAYENFPQVYVCLLVCKGQDRANGLMIALKSTTGAGFFGVVGSFLKHRLYHHFFSLKNNMKNFEISFLFFACSFLLASIFVQPAYENFPQVYVCLLL